MCCMCRVVLRDGVLREPACGGRALREAGAEGRRAGWWLGRAVTWARFRYSGRVMRRYAMASFEILRTSGGGC